MPNPITIRVDTQDVSLNAKLESLPAKPGVYQFKNADGKIIYIGKAIQLRNRVRQYFQKSRNVDVRIEAMIGKVRDVEIIVTDSEVEALILEATLIKQFRPRYNVDLKDDKSYPYIVITNEPYPRVFVTRRIIRDGSRYFGPYTDVRSMRASLKMVRELFHVRSCNYFIDEESIRKHKVKVCLDYHIKKCEGPCEGLVGEDHYAAMIGEIAQVLKGKTTTLTASLTSEMNRLAEGLEFEKAAALRDKIAQLGVYSERQKVLDAETVDRDIFGVARDEDNACGVVFKVRDGKFTGKRHVYMSGVKHADDGELVQQFVERYYLDTDDLPGEVFLPLEVEDRETIGSWLASRLAQPIELVVPKIGEKAKLVAMCVSNAKYLLQELKLQKLKQKEIVPISVTALQNDLRLRNLPRRIECFDISNLQGTDTVASMVVFVDGKPKKSEYRKFKIQGVHGPDDFASMREVIGRRYAKIGEEAALPPDLIMVDGGKGQLSSAVGVLSELGLTEVPIIGLAKRLEEVFIPSSPEAQYLSKTSPALKLLQQVRNEAHRFAITYHRVLRSKRTLQSELDLVKGIGKARARELLELFGSVQGVKFATAEQLAEAVGERLALRIKGYFGSDEPESIETGQ